jgi:cytochrome c oxidase subunit 2
MEQRVAVLLSALLGALVIAAFVVVARSASQTGSPEEIAAAAAHWRRNLFWSLVLLFVPVIGFSLTKMPYGAADGPAAVVIQATGHQWAWEMTPATVVAGQRVEVHVTGADVNHGFGVYDTNNRLITQAQAMPGFTNVIRHTFTTPGTYRVLCLEYCGLGHHTMVAQLVVTPAAAGAQ